MRILWRIIVKELQQLRRDRKMIPVILVAPVVQLIAFGYAANRDVTRVPTLLVDQDRTSASRELVDRFTSSGYFELVGAESSVADIDPWLVSGRANLALVIAAGYGDAIVTGRHPRVQIIADGSDAASAVIGLGYASGVIARKSAELVRRPPGGPGRLVGLVEGVPRVWYNPDLRSRWFYVPAVLAMVLMTMTMILSSMALVREKEIGTIEQISVTPIRPWQLIAGKLLPFFAIGIVDTVLVAGLAIGWFGVPLRGSLVLLLLLTGLFLLTTLGLGLMVSSFCRNQQQAMMSAAFLLMIPMIYLSGLIFPIENMPRSIQVVTYAVPLRYYTNIIRGLFLKGSGLDVLWPDALILAGFGLLVLGVAAGRFRKRLD